MTERRQLRFMDQRSRWDGGTSPTRGWVLSTDGEVLAAMRGEYRRGVSKNGKAWERWDNRSASFYSIRSGRLRIYERVRDKGHRYFRELTASPVAPLLPWPGGESPAVLPAIYREWEALVGPLPGYSKDSRIIFRDLQRVALPALRMNDGWEPVYGIPRALQQTNGRDMITAELGVSRYRKDLLKALGASSRLDGLMVARALRTRFPIDWLVSVVRWDGMGTVPYSMAKELAEMLSRLPERQQRLLIADLPNVMWLGDTLNMAQRIQNGALPRAYTWGELHTELTPLANRAARRMANGPIPQEGPSAKLDGLKVGQMELRSAKETHELVRWGEHMHHCIGSYGYQAATGSSHLFGLFEGDKLIANLELDPHGKVRQFYGKYNANPDATVRTPVVSAIQRKMRK